MLIFAISEAYNTVCINFVSRVGGLCIVVISRPGASEGSEETKHWRGKPLVMNNGLLQWFLCSEPSDAPAW